MFSKGQVVISKRGRDTGKMFIVIGVCNEYLYLADGRLRKLEKPKKKKMKHVQIVGYIDVDISQKLCNGMALYDSDIRAALAGYRC